MRSPKLAVEVIMSLKVNVLPPEAKSHMILKLCVKHWDFGRTKFVQMVTLFELE